MALINYALREVTCKLVYYGTGMGGKTTNLAYIHRQLPAQVRGDLISLESADERTLFFDFMALDLGSVQGFRTRFSLYTVPGQVIHDTSRKLILNGADGVIFVADSAPDMQDANAESLQNLTDNLATYGQNLETLPWVLQFNKRDLPDAVPISEMERRLNRRNVPGFEAVALEGRGVFAALKALAKDVLRRLS